jgi:hypothetical protein
MPAQWSRMRLISLIATLFCAGLAGAIYVSSVAYTGDFDGTEEFWLLIFSGVVAAIAYFAAHVRDEIVDHIRPIRQEVDDLPLHIADYGDRREVAGHQLAARVGGQQRRGLNSVD